MLASDIAHDAKSLDAVRFRFTRVAEDDIKPGADTGLLRLSRGFIHVRDSLMLLVHEREHLLGGGLGAETHIVKAALAELTNILIAHAADEIGRGLNRPAKFCLLFQQTASDGNGAF